MEKRYGIIIIHKTIINAISVSYTGYHYYITRDGRTYQTRHEQLVGAHAVGYNQHSLGVCYEGGLNEHGNAADTRTPRQKRALLRLLKKLKAAHPDAQILGHRDLPDVNKDCPCFDAIAEYQDLQPANV